jgi:hypothetical protein
MSSNKGQSFYNPILLILIALVAYWNLAGCRRSPRLEPATRPNGVPGDAVWAGGADGGAYIRCSVDNAQDYNVCTVWNDFTGEAYGPANYRLELGARAATQQELSFQGAANERIYLKGGGTLRRLNEPKTSGS